MHQLLRSILWTTKNAFSLNSLALQSQEFIHQEVPTTKILSQTSETKSEPCCQFLQRCAFCAEIYSQAVKASNIKSRGVITLSPKYFCPHYCWRAARTHRLALLKAAARPSGQRGHGFRQRYAAPKPDGNRHLRYLAISLEFAAGPEETAMFRTHHSQRSYISL